MNRDDRQPSWATSRRGYLGAVGAAVAVPLAGCGGDGDEGVPASSPTETESPTTTGEPVSATPAAVLDVRGDWRTKQADPGRTGSERRAVGPTGESIEPAWRYDAGSPMRSSPVVVDGRVFVGTDDGRLLALDVNAGTLQWSYGAGDTIAATPTVADETVIVGSDDGTLYGVDAVTGEELWTYDAGGAIRGCAAVSDGTAYVTSADGTAAAVHARLGDPVWEFSIVAEGTGTPALSDRSVLVGTRGGRTLKLAREDGAVDWTHTSGAAGVSPSPTVVDEVVYVGTPPGDDAAYKLAHGTANERWRYGRTGGVVGSAAVAEGRVVWGSLDRYVHCAEGQDGARAWIYQTTDKIVASPAIADGVVHIGSEDNGVYAIDLASGEEVWSVFTEGAIRTAPAVVDGVCVVSSSDGSVYALAEA